MDRHPPIWWTFVTQPVGWFVARQERRLDGKFVRDLDAWGKVAPLGIFGAGSDTAGGLLLAAGDNPERLARRLRSPS